MKTDSINREEDIIMAETNKNKKNSLPFSSKLAENLNDLNERVFTNKKVSLIIIDGASGEGKTTLAVHIADYINHLHALPDIDLEGSQLAMGGDAFSDKLEVCQELKLPVCIYDEAGDFSKRGALTQFNAMINRIFDTFRAYKVIVILCLPTLDSLDSSLFDKKIPRLLLNLYDRGQNYGNFRAYGFDRMNWIKWRMKKAPIKSYAYGYVSPNFRGHFLNLPQERSDKLDKVSTEAKKDSNKLLKAKMEGLMSYVDMGKILGRSAGTLKTYSCYLKLKPDKIIQKKAFFGEENFMRLKNYIEGESEEGGEDEE